MRGYDFTIIPKHKFQFIPISANRCTMGEYLQNWQTYRDEAAKEDAV